MEALARKKLEELKTACIKSQKTVFIRRNAKETASADFNLNGKKAILDFIAKGMEDIRHYNTRDLEKNETGHDISVFAFLFKSGLKGGYFAFYFNPDPDTNSWVVKSLKSDRDRVKAFGDAIDKALERKR